MEIKQLGEKIAEARRKINISQAQLAGQLFISPQAVGKWERGESVPDMITMAKLAKALNVDLNYFSANSENANHNITPASVAQPILTANASEKAGTLSWNMSRGNWVDADFSGLKGLHDKFFSSNIQRCKFVGSEMNGVLLKDNNIQQCDLSGSAINGGRFQNSHMVDDQFTACSLRDTAFADCHIKNCDFSGADLTGATFNGCAVQKATFEATVLERTSFTGTHLAEVLFSCTLRNCVFENSALSKVVFKNAVLLNTFFKCKTLKQARFVDCQADRLTYEFLKNAKADVSGITLIGE